MLAGWGETGLVSADKNKTTLVGWSYLLGWLRFRCSVFVAILAYFPKTLVGAFREKWKKYTISTLVTCFTRWYHAMLLIKLLLPL